MIKTIDCEICGYSHSSLDEFGDVYDCWVHKVNKKIKLRKLTSLLRLISISTSKGF